MIDVVLVDDHELTRRGIRQVLSETPDFRVVGEAANGNEAWELIQRIEPDVALLDIRMSGIQGPALCQMVKSAGLRTACIILTSYTDDALLRSALASGACGYIIKDVTAPELVESIRRIVAGGAVLDPRATAQVVRWFEDGQREPAAALDPVDIQILSLAAEGLNNRDIGIALNYSANTVKAHINRIVKTLGAKNRVEAVVIAYQRGLI
ncbi:two component LuxR family transcriptional regulator [Sulfobacillus acidophilus TPY]|uniref:Stage 0 sporulation protein A homolog n=1 Tax=Sulfobacillus acidophilus (strain ATCC 700253 / DSM 10332 / NAL) TaxID=679936 RepID=G8TYR5_SULAD|nr:two component LuxR family transcriptional regulator [Sulfobacillus acidophilus TPY]AEW04030.1 two component transcriptional regulator, LuxR family [Sulfobacillus acidophilus DSM 10332]